MKMTPAEKITFDNLFEDLKNDLDDTEEEVRRLRAAEQASRVVLKFDTSEADKIEKARQLSIHNASLAKLTAYKISQDVGRIFDAVETMPNAAIDLSTKHNKDAKDFNQKNKNLEFDLNTESAKELAKNFESIKYRYSDDIKDPEKNGFSLEFQLKVKLEAKSHTLTKLFDSLREIDGIKAKQEGGVYVIRFSSRQAIDATLQEMKDSKSNFSKGLMDDMLSALKNNENFKEFSEKANESLKEKNDNERKKLLEKYPEVTGDPAKLKQFNDNSDDNLKIQQKIAELELFRKAVSEGKIDDILKNAAVENVVESMFKKFSKIMGVVAEAANIPAKELDSFVREEFDKYNNSSRDPLVTRAKSKITENDLTLIKGTLMDSIAAKIVEEEKNLGTNTTDMSNLLGPQNTQSRQNSHQNTHQQKHASRGSSAVASAPPK